MRVSSGIGLIIYNNGLVNYVLFLRMKFILENVLSQTSAILMLMSAITGCSVNTDESLAHALKKAGSNRPQLEGVLRHFRDDPEKLSGAEYLISNMPYNFSQKGDELERYKACYHLFSEYGQRAFAMMDSISQRCGELNLAGLERVMDYEAVDSVFLIKDIERAYATRRDYQWSANIPEENFIRYVLPYRIKDEALESWRDSVAVVFKDLTDSLRYVGCADLLTVARTVMKKWNEKEFRWTGMLPSGPAIGMANVFDKAGTCLEFAHGAVYLMRALGIPSGIDMVQIRGENNSSHFWPFILDEDGNTYVASTENPDWIPAKDFDISAAKIYRMEFGLNEEYASLYDNRSGMPPFFAVPRFSDVTHEYKPGKSFQLSFDIPLADKNPLLLLSSNDGWIPVDMADNEMSFDNVAGGVVAWLGKWEEGKAVPVSDPFKISSADGKIAFINCQGREREMTVFSKFPLNQRNGDIVDRVMGGVIEGSDNPSFIHADTIYQITVFPKRKINFVSIDRGNTPYRYYRYRGADNTYCNIAEVALYSDVAGNERMSGKFFGTEGAWDNDTTHSYKKVFDGDLDTSFDYKYPSGGWSALDLGIPRSVRSIMFAPRNRDNYVREGDTYELFYFSDLRWNSAGRKTAESDSLSFIVPSGILYYLKNHSRGKDERIFEYDFDRREQIFR